MRLTVTTAQGSTCHNACFASKQAHPQRTKNRSTAIQAACKQIPSSRHDSFAVNRNLAEKNANSMKRNWNAKSSRIPTVLTSARSISIANLRNYHGFRSMCAKNALLKRGEPALVHESYIISLKCNADSDRTSENALQTSTNELCTFRLCRRRSRLRNFSLLRFRKNRIYTAASDDFWNNHGFWSTCVKIATF